MLMCHAHRYGPMAPAPGVVGPGGAATGDPPALLTVTSIPQHHQPVVQALYGIALIGSGGDMSMAAIKKGAHQ